MGRRASALLAKLGLTPGRAVEDMIVVGPTGRGCSSRHERGELYPDHGRAITRVRFDAWLRDDAAAGAEPVTGRVAAVRAGTVELDGIDVNSAAQVIVGALAV